MPSVQPASSEQTASRAQRRSSADESADMIVPRLCPASVAAANSHNQTSRFYSSCHRLTLHSCPLSSYVQCASRSAPVPAPPRPPRVFT